MQHFVGSGMTLVTRQSGSAEHGNQSGGSNNCAKLQLCLSQRNCGINLTPNPVTLLIRLDSRPKVSTAVTDDQA
jgi:hypothetical protein